MMLGPLYVANARFSSAGRSAERLIAAFRADGGAGNGLTSNELRALVDARKPTKADCGTETDSRAAEIRRAFVLRRGTLWCEQ